MAGGRPTDYKPELLEIVGSMCLSGATDSEIADEIGVSVSTLYNWRGKYPEFLAVMKYGKEQADQRVERGLYQRAVGFEYPAVKVSFDKDGTPLFAQYREYYPPDTTAAKHWLNNRDRANWREKIEQEVTGKDGGPVQFVVKSILEE